MTKKSMKAAGYVRVSTPGQAREGLSLAEQADSISQFVESQGWSLAGVYEDAGLSASKDYRTRRQFRRMLRDATNGKFDVVVVSDMTRFSRNPKDYFLINSQLEEIGVGVLTLDNPNFDATDDGQVLGREVQVIIGKFTARQSRAKSLRVKQSKLDAGNFNLGQRVPYGLQWDGENGKLIHDPERLNIWDLMKHLRRTGFGYGRIAEVLNGDRELDENLAKKFDVHPPIPNRFGQKIWRDGSISSMFRDQSRYTGQLELKFKTLKGKIKTYWVPCATTMTKHEYDTYRRISAKNCCWVPRNVGKGSVLSGLCACGECGSKLHVTGSHGYLYYGCSRKVRHKRQRCALPLIRKRDLEDRVLRDLAFLFKDDQTFNKALMLADSKLNDSVAMLVKVKAELKKVEKEHAICNQRFERMLDAVESGALVGDDILPRKLAIQGDRERAFNRKLELETLQLVLERDQGQLQQVTAARTAFGDLLGRWDKLDTLTNQQKQDLLHQLFPPEAGPAVTVYTVTEKTPQDPDSPEPIGSWYVEICGVLPIEGSNIGNAVLGGALAVP